MSSAYAYPGYTNMPAPSDNIIPQQPPRVYQLEVSQQPIRARMCGFGEKDRRPIDPPPVVRLIMTTPDGKPIPESSVDPSMFVVHAGLWSNNRKEERSLVINPSSIPTQSTGPSSTVMSLNGPTCTRNLMGSLTSSAYTLTNQHGQQGIYFVFQDLSVRTEGTFTLKFQFADISQLVKRGGPQSQVRVEAEVYSESFTVYSAKKFPGMTESTELSKAFAKQGIKIPIRKETRYRRPHDDLRRVLEGPNPGITSSLPASGDHDIDKSDNGEDKGPEYESENDDDVDDNSRSSTKHRTN